jgi:hypothetical protein
MVAIEGESMRPVTRVVVEEVRSGDWGIAGKPLTTQDVKALAAAPARFLLYPGRLASGVVRPMARWPATRGARNAASTW